MQRTGFVLALLMAFSLVACTHNEEPIPQKPSTNNNGNGKGNNNNQPVPGACSDSCTDGTTCCGGKCVNITIDSDNCGKCDNKCSDLGSDLVCRNNECVKVICDEGAVRCNVANLEICRNNTWEIHTPCKDNTPVCSEEQKKCIPKPANCQEGVGRCTNNKLEICADGDYEEVKTCDNDREICDAEGKTCKLKPGVICEDDAKKCEDNKVWSCSNNTWSVVKTCTDQMCDDKAKDCVDIVCTDGEKACRDGDVYVCDSNAYTLDKNCDDTTQLCKNNECITKVCSEGDFRCNDSENRMEFCSNNEWVGSTPCRDNEYCDKGATITETVCRPLCGNGKVDTEKGELCDGSNLGDGTCASATGDSSATGNVTCNGNCKGFVTTGCQYCGDGVKNGTEVCDGSDFGPATCASVKDNEYSSGLLKCSKNCQSISTESCTNPECSPKDNFACNQTNTVLSMCDQGTWKPIQTCTKENPICKADSHNGCIAMEGACEESSIICNGNIMLGCDNGEWIHMATCSGDKPYCDQDLVQCLAAAPQCTKEGDLKCQGNTVMRCSNYQWVTDADCTKKDSGVNPVCLDGACVYSTEPCTGDALSCDSKGESVISCYEGHLYWSFNCKQSTNNTKPYCVNNGECAASANACATGAVRCNGQSYEECDAEEWVQLSNCAENVLNPTCNVSASPSDYCTAGCSKDHSICHNNSVYMCDENQAWINMESDCGLFTWCNLQWANAGNAGGRILPANGKDQNNYEGRLVCTKDVNTPLKDWVSAGAGTYNSGCDPNSCGSNKEFMNSTITLNPGTWYCTYQFRDKEYDNWYACLPNFKENNGPDGGAPIEILPTTKLDMGKIFTINIQ